MSSALNRQGGMACVCVSVGVCAWVRVCVCVCMCVCVVVVVVGSLKQVNGRALNKKHKEGVHWMNYKNDGDEQFRAPLGKGEERSWKEKEKE